MYKRIFDGLVKDISALGSAIFYFFVIVLFWLLHYYSVATKLFLGIVISCGVVVVIRLVYFTPRPKEKNYNNLFQKVNNGSFPSHHSANAGLLTAILSSVIPGLNSLLFFAIFSAGVMASRVYLKKHYLKDTIFGFLIGLIVGVLII